MLKEALEISGAMELVTKIFKDIQIEQNLPVNEPCS